MVPVADMFAATVSHIVFRLDMLSDAQERLGEYDESVAAHEREIAVLRSRRSSAASTTPSSAR
ncbi:hypothetical protein AB0M48_12055 [Lentzea sp. NPDC051208]|uniref:hypothetical protein n=1 Tax=Lentzea sp. NPDC051208 TaxID=3154642 RepID=UPI003449A7EE